jgi:hypothetical protein
LEREIGRGGMGMVYLASRADQQYEKRVAIKLLSGVTRERALQRFRAERQILAKLDHPNIARMLDGGVTESGEPYFVMEYIPGAAPIDEYCDRHRLPVRARLELFLHACEAVQYAHQFLVVHRDLKPSNVVVSRDGVVKLMDFGIARDLLAGIGSEIHEPALPTSGGGPASMTPAYASPEQMRGAPIETSSDIYSLGVMLFEILTGASPYVSPPGDLDRLMEAVAHGVTIRPSLCYTARDAEAPSVILANRGLLRTRELERIFEGDLDAIITKAMAPHGPDRYKSADEMARDMRHYLTGKPVSSMSATPFYRVRKLFERNRLVLSVGTGLLAVAMAWAGAMSAMAIQARSAAAEARDRQLLAEAVSSFILGRMTQASANQTSLEVLRQATLEADAQFAASRATRAAVHLALGEAMLNMGYPVEAQELFHRCVLELSSLGSQKHRERVRAMAGLGESLLRAGEYAQAVRWYEQAVEEYGAGPDKGSADWNPATRARLLDGLHRAENFRTNGLKSAN